MFDLDGYLERIGLRGRPGLAELHLAHCTSIPFEALDPQRGMAVSLREEDLFQKLVMERRGGYCFEQNMLLAAALRALGIETELYLARVLLGADPQAPRPRSHLLLRAVENGRAWHADVGFGGGPLLEPLPWGPGEEHEQGGWRYRLLEREPEYVLQTVDGDQWVDVYGFIPHPVPEIDVETINWWTSTHPDSRFVNGLMVSRHWGDGRRLVVNDWGEDGVPALLEIDPSATVRTPVSWTEVPDLLAERFQMPGFTLREDGRLDLVEKANA
jgi:N-hydroxyarylamine O-acetyltransferase